jgi:DNA ligase (NAD+)
MNKIDRIKELVEQLNYHRNLYYNESRSEISDFEYDQLFDELSKLEKEIGLILSTSPTQTVGYEVKSSLNKVTHNHPMLSLDKTKNVDDVIKFLGGRDGVVMAKMDGLTCSLRYLNGELVSAETRGNGEVGEDILHCAKTIKNLPLRIECLNEVIVDGEVIITYDDFEKINETLPDGEKYKHPRNLASGSIRQLDSSVAAQRNMQFIAWKLVKGWMSCCDEHPMSKNSFIDRLYLLYKLGFEVVPVYSIKNIRVTERINNFIELIKTTCKNSGFPIDGCVFGYDDVVYGESLGATGHHLRSQLAFKFYDELYDTKLLNIDWTMGKTGVLTPTAVFESVEIDGTNVERASLHNISIIKSLGLTNGCTVRVYKANAIVPQVDSCEQDGNGEIEIPSLCPVCGGTTAIQKDNDTEVLICTNPECSGKLLGKLTHFVSKKGADISGLSEATIETFIDVELINSFVDIYRLKNHKDKLLSLPGFGKKSVEKLLLSIENSRELKLENFICALGIPNIGLSASKTIAKSCDHNLGKLIMMWANNYDFTQLDDFGQVMAKSFTDYFDEYINEIEELAYEMIFIASEKNNDTSLNGLRFCITGSFSQSRDELKKKLEDKGAKFVSSVSKNLDILFCGDNAGSKLTKAQSLGIKVADENELLKLLG